MLSAVFLFSHKTSSLKADPATDVSGLNLIPMNLETTTITQYATAIIFKYFKVSVKTGRWKTKQTTLKPLTQIKIHISHNRTAFLFTINNLSRVCFFSPPHAVFTLSQNSLCPLNTQIRKLSLTARRAEIGADANLSQS